MPVVDSKAFEIENARVDIELLNREIARLKEARRVNGWANYETWVVNVWLDNDQAAAADIRSRTASAIQAARQELGAENVQEWTDLAVFNIATSLKDTHDDCIPPMVEGVFLDLIRGALQEVDWPDIARHLVDQFVIEEAANNG